MPIKQALRSIASLTLSTSPAASPRKVPLRKNSRSGPLETPHRQRKTEDFVTDILNFYSSGEGRSLSLGNEIPASAGKTGVGSAAAGSLLLINLARLRLCASGLRTAGGNLSPQ